MLPDRLTAQQYRDFLGNVLSQLLANVALVVREREVLVSAQKSSRALRGKCPEVVERIISRNVDCISRAVAWPPRPPDLTPMGLSLWRHPKEHV
jgi:hypothetical protein